MKGPNRTNKAAVAAQNNQVEPPSQDGEQSVDEQVAEAVEQSYGRKLVGGPANLSEEERQRIQDKCANSKT
ncbi:hypothetical protein [Bradyrhizobium sp. URHD0069]|jgi:hypothetical protein|uniref:hypothetical protein n=1 Tax=Bradyrhizobium sp. URHD0069 TaxID=1380355 RepID=UPI000496C4D8|nr:hypothetical protein [Bradyrhizobium sp. URHD0069]